MSKGIHTFIKLNVLPSHAIPSTQNSIEDPRLQNVIKQGMKTKRSIDDLSTNNDSHDEEAIEVKKKDKKKDKKKSKNKKWERIWV